GDEWGGSVSHTARIDGVANARNCQVKRWILILGLSISTPSWAQASLRWSAGSAQGSLPWGIVVLLTLLTVLPAILLCMTPFVRLLVVFHFLRHALGTQTTPTNQTLIGL